MKMFHREIDCFHGIDIKHVIVKSLNIDEAIKIACKDFENMLKNKYGYFLEVLDSDEECESYFHDVLNKANEYVEELRYWLIHNVHDVQNCMFIGENNV